MRSYKKWCDLISQSENIIIRHDIDFDIEVCRRMMEIERERGLTSVVYVDVHSPSYSMDDIRKLYEDFMEFDFGLHVNVAYDYEKDRANAEFVRDAANLREVIPVGSCSGHYYDSTLIDIPEYNNVDVEREGDESGYLMSFDSQYGPFDMRFGDGGGKMLISIIDWLGSVKNKRCYIQIHPVHYKITNGDVIYTKKIGAGDAVPDFKKISEKSTPYFKGVPFHVQSVSVILCEFARSNYRKLIRVIDAGCGVGYLGLGLQELHNVKYVGMDTEQRFLDVATDYYADLGYEPDFIQGNLYEKQPRGDCLVFLGYEDCYTDYDDLLEVCKQYSEVFISIITEHRYKEALERNKSYYYIERQEFEKKYLCYFTIKSYNLVGDRHVYHLKRRK